MLVLFRVCLITKLPLSNRGSRPSSTDQIPVCPGAFVEDSQDFLKPDTVVQLGYPPRRIDLLTAPSGVHFNECYENRMKFENGTMIDFISLDDLKVNKAASGRPRDLADIQDLS